MINNHILSHPSSKDKQTLEERKEIWKDILLEDNSVVRAKNTEVIDQNLLKKYIIYARNNVKPKLTEVDKEKITKFYTDLRKESLSSGGINIAVRHIESVIRMAEGAFLLQWSYSNDPTFV